MPDTIPPDIRQYLMSISSVRSKYLKNHLDDWLECSCRKFDDPHISSRRSGMAFRSRKREDCGNQEVKRKLENYGDIPPSTTFKSTLFRLFIRTLRGSDYFINCKSVMCSRTILLLQII